MASTIYDVMVRYNVKDNATRGLNSIDRASRRASKSSGMLAGALRRVMVAAGAYLGFRAAKKHLIDFNATLQQSKIQIAGIRQLNLGGAWSDNMKSANTLVTQFQKIAEKSVGTTQDFVDMASNIAAPIMNAGLGMTELRDITKGAVIAGRAFGTRAELVALDIEQMLAGTLTKKDRFARKLLTPMGYDTSAWNAMDAQMRAAKTMEAVSQQGILNMAKAQEQSFSGVLSTLQDKLSILLGRVGKPLFEAITKEISNWITYMEKNQLALKNWAADFGKTLKDAFGVVKSVFKFVAAHKDLLLNLAKAALIFKGVKVVGGALAGAAAFLGGAGGKGGGLGGATNKLALFAAACQLAADSILDWQDARVKKEGKKPLLFLENLRKGGTATPFMVKELKDLGLVGKSGKINWKRFQEISGEKMAGRTEAGLQGFKSKRTRELEAGLRNLVATRDLPAQKEKARQALMAGMQHTAAMIKHGEDMMRAARWALMGEKKRKEVQQNFKNIVKFFGNIVAPLAQGMKSTFSPWLKLFGIGDKKVDKPKVNVHVHRIEVQSDDPDRFVFGMISAFQDAALNPTQAVDTLQEGGG
jgi:hypothetical protein